MLVAAHHPLTNRQPAAADTHQSGIAEWVDHTVGQWRSRIKERHNFTGFDHRELHDLGLSRWEVERELAKPFWRG